jgi:DNA-binding NarL/FixJ family response regulator
MSAIKIAIVDDQRLFRQGLTMLIKSVEGFELTIEGENGAHFLEELKQSTLLPDIALVDVDMPGINGIELNQTLKQLYPDIKVIMLSVHAEEYLISQVIKDGAVAYLFKNCDKDELVSTIRGVYKNGFYINHAVFNAVQQAHQLKAASVKALSNASVNLTRREKQVLHLICKELNNAEIAEKLYVSIRTIEGHRNNLLIKTGCRNTAGLVLFAVNNNLHLMQD